MVFSLVYSSTTDHDWSADELVGLLEWSRSWNIENAVTGILLYRDCAFMQFLEGDESTVRALFGRIRIDRRHQDVDLMWTFETEHRRFDEWSMAFRELARQPVGELGYDEAVSEVTGVRAIETDDEHDDVLVDFLSVFGRDPAS